MDAPGREERHERHDEKMEKATPKAIDNQVLAAMLRESASIVERGEFEPILYTALQDFRVYYKLHYPTKKKKRRSRSRSLTHETKNTSSDPPEENSSKVNGETSKPDSSRSVDSTQNAASNVAEQEASVPVQEDAEPTIITLVDSKDSIDITSQDLFEQEPRTEPPIPDVTTLQTDFPVSPTFARPVGPMEDHISPAGTIQKATSNMLFGKLKFPMKIGVTLPNPAFAVTSKKNAERAKEDLEAFNGALAQQAESSRRRKVGDEDGATWCELHFTMNCACLPTTTSTSTTTSGPLSQSRRLEPAPSMPGQLDQGKLHSYQTHDGAPPAPTPVATQAPTTQPPINTNTPSTLPVAPGPPSRVTSPGEVSVASSSQATVETTAATTTATSVKDIPSNPFQGGAQSMTQQPVVPLKPDFQRPANANSSLIANGWIEQYRRSKMRFVWKEVLASLVQGRRPGEETTLWIQREIVNPITHKKELEALHQIPVKLLETCTYLDYSTDNRFTIKVYNAAEEFIFRSRTDVAAAKWVQILKKHRDIARGGAATFEEEKKGSDTSPPSRMTVNDLRAICHGAGINTAGMERGQLEAAAEEVKRRGTYFPPPPGAPQHFQMPQTAATQQHPLPPQSTAATQQHPLPPQSTAAAPPPPPHAPQTARSAKLNISELRAICHGAGINTAGMERIQLERAAEEVLKRGTYFPPTNAHPPPPPSGSAPQPQPVPPQTQTSAGTIHSGPAAQPSRTVSPSQNESTQERLSVSELRAICHGAGINTVGMERQQLEKAAEEVRKRGTYFDPPSTNPSAASSSQPSAASVPDELQKDAAKRREAEEQMLRAKEEEHRRRVAEQEHQRRVAEQQAAEQSRRYAEQQAAWQKQQQEEEHRRRMAEQQAAEQRRRHEEAVRQQQHWQQQQQWHKQQQWNQQQQQQQQQWPPQQAHSQQHPQWQQQQHQQQQKPQAAPHPQQPQQQQQPHQSAASEKYAKMANQTDDDGQAAITRIKHDILINWALQPPHLQMLRPISVLVTTIHKVFPPALGVPAHEYFSKWKALGPADVSDNGVPDEERLKKSVRKIRFFLHPDKLPKDLNSEQAFMVKMLWDITSDAWEEFEKRKADLDWIK